jgi:hypothetical protein
MSDDLVKRARHNALSDMPHYASVELIEALADRIEELEKRANTFADGWRKERLKMIDAEAKLATAVEALEFWQQAQEPDIDESIELMQTTLAELKGDK